VHFILSPGYLMFGEMISRAFVLSCRFLMDY
jgi:hypothetical protein